MFWSILKDVILIVGTKLLAHVLFFFVFVEELEEGSLKILTGFNKMLQLLFCILARSAGKIIKVCTSYVSVILHVQLMNSYTSINFANANISHVKLLIFSFQHLL